MTRTRVMNMGKMNKKGMSSVANAESALMEVMGETSRLQDSELEFFPEDNAESSSLGFGACQEQLCFSHNLAGYFDFLLP